MKMGEIIRKLRLERGMTQEQLGKVIGVQKSAIRKYENGSVQNIKRSSIKKLADFFGVSPSYLLGYAEEETDAPVSEIEEELISLSRKMTTAQRVRLLSYAYDILKEEK